MLITLGIAGILKAKVWIMKITNSKALFNKAKKIIPGQSQTFSKSWTQYPLGCSPIFSDNFLSGRGSDYRR